MPALRRFCSRVSLSMHALTQVVCAMCVCRSWYAAGSVIFNAAITSAAQSLRCALPIVRDGSGVDGFACCEEGLGDGPVSMDEYVNHCVSFIVGRFHRRQLPIACNPLHSGGGRFYAENDLLCYFRSCDARPVHKERRLGLTMHTRLAPVFRSFQLRLSPSEFFAIPLCHQKLLN